MEVPRPTHLSYQLQEVDADERLEPRHTQEIFNRLRPTEDFEDLAPLRGDGLGFAYVIVRIGSSTN